MNKLNSELDNWLAGLDSLDEPASADETWAVAFEPDRQLVKIKFGPYQKLKLRPANFTKRFYHQLFPLAIESWGVDKQLTLFESFCTLDVSLKLRFQPTFSYAQKNSEVLATINQHIKQTYTDVIDDAIDRELQSLPDGHWVQTGLEMQEKSIALNLCEFLMLQGIQAQATCAIKATFAEFPAVKLGRENVYFNLLKKTFEFTEQRNLEMARQQQALSEQLYREKLLHLDNLKQVTDLERQIQAQEAEKERLLLEDQEKQLAMKLAVEKRLHAERLRHQQELQEMAFEAELVFEERQKARLRLSESQQLTDHLAHQAILEDKRIKHEQQRQADRQMQQSPSADDGNAQILSEPIDDRSL